MSIKDFVAANASKYSSREDLIKTTMTAMGSDRDAVVRVVKRYTHLLQNTPTAKCSLGLTEKELRARHDKTFIIMQALKTLKKDEFIEDRDMRDKVCKISTSHWRQHSEKGIFDQYKMKLDGKIYWGVPSEIAKLKEELNAA